MRLGIQTSYAVVGQPRTFASPMTIAERVPSLPYVAPFAVFMVLLATLPLVDLSPRADAVTRVVIVGTTLVVVGRPAIDLRVKQWGGTIAIGLGVFLVWIAPDLLIPGWRANAAFQNAITGTLTVSMPPEARGDVAVLGLRIVRAALLVPILEELFWRAWLPRFLDAKDFRSRPLGAFTALSFTATTVLFAAEHGPFWEVGLVAGVAYNWWMMRTRSLGDLIVAHAVTNLLLSAFVLFTERWEFWM